MGTVTRMDEYRPKLAPAAVPNLMAGITRTPELALVMALYDALPRAYQGVALAKVMLMAERTPDCEASEQAGRIAALLALRQEGK